MKRRVIVYSLVVVSFLVGATAFAAGSVTANITNVRVSSDGKAIIFFSASLSGSPSCASSSPSELSFDSTTPAGKSFLSLALAAKLGHAGVFAGGTGTCSVFAGDEALAVLILMD